MANGKAWSKGELASLKQLWSAHRDEEKVAALLGRTKGSVTAALWKHGIREPKFRHTGKSKAKKNGKVLVQITYPNGNKFTGHVPKSVGDQWLLEMAAGGK